MQNNWEVKAIKEILQTIIENLVDNSEAVEIKQTDEPSSVLLEVKVAEGDMGKVIGKSGRIAKAIRVVVKAAASKGDKKVIVDIR